MNFVNKAHCPRSGSLDDRIPQIYRVGKRTANFGNQPLRKLCNRTNAPREIGVIKRRAGFTDAVARVESKCNATAS